MRGYEVAERNAQEQNSLATVTETVDYVGSLTADRRLPRQRISFLTKKSRQNTNNGSRFVTYVIETERQGEIHNGAAARLAEPEIK